MIIQRTQQERDWREKIRKANEAKLYQYKAAFYSILEYLHRDIDLYSADIEDSTVSVRTESMVWYQQWVSGKIDEHDDLSIWNKCKGNIF